MTWLPTGCSTRLAHAGTIARSNETGLRLVHVDSNGSPVAQAKPAYCTVTVSPSATWAPAPRTSGCVTRSVGGAAADAVIDGEPSPPSVTVGSPSRGATGSPDARVASTSSTVTVGQFAAP